MYLSAPFFGLLSSIRCSGRMYRWNKVSSRVRMWAPSTSASLIKMTRWYLADSRSKALPEPAPRTWMMAAHSAFFSMSASDAFWTFRILPLIGRRAWNSESRASFAVPRAESPSTMNSSLRSSALRQSTSLAGGAQGGGAREDEQLAAVFGAAVVRQLGGQRRAGQRGLAPLVLPVLASGDPGLGGRSDLLEHRLCLRLTASVPA